MTIAILIIAAIAVAALGRFMAQWADYAHDDAYFVDLVHRAKLSMDREMDLVMAKLEADTRAKLMEKIERVNQV